MLLVIHCVHIVVCYYHYYSLLYLIAELTVSVSGFCYIIGHILVGCISLCTVNQLCSLATTLMEHFQAFKFNKGWCNFIKHVTDQGH